MSRKSTQAIHKHSTTSRLFGSGKGKSPSRSVTSETIADDIAAFKKHGGRIEILGNTPLRTRTQIAAPGKSSARG